MKSFYGLRLPPVIITMLVTLGVLWAGYTFYEQKVVRGEVERELRRVVRFERLVIAREERPPAVYLYLSRTPDLRRSYLAARGVVSRVLGPGYRLYIGDRRTPRLQALYEACQFAIYEAIATGSFTEMARVVEEKAAAAGASWKLALDPENVYVQLEEKNGYLYEVIPRWPPLGEEEKLDGGGT